MKLRAKSSFSLGGGRDVHPGDLFVLPDVAARLKIRQGDAEEVVEESAPAAPTHPEAGRPDVVTHRDPEPEHNDPRPAKSRR